MPRGIPEYTDHGVLHSNNVLRYIRDIMKEYPVELSEEERFILAICSFLHDIGCIVGREKHNERTITILSRKQFDFIRFLLGQTRYRALECVIIAHCRSFDLSKVPNDPSPEIRLKLISALFRLADACDVSAVRIKRVLLEVLIDEHLLDQKSEEIWKSHLQIENVLIKEHKIKPQIYDKKLAEPCLANMREELTSINLTLSELGHPVFILEPDVVKESILERP